MTQSMTGHVFLSYSRKDEAVMRRILIFLRNQGIKVWVDNEKLVPGTPIWETEIEKAITSANAVIAILSPDSKKSEWVRREISFAEQYDKRIFPVLVRGSEDTSISIRLITSQFVDLRQNEISGLNSLNSALAVYLNELKTWDGQAQKTTKRIASEQVTKKPFNLLDCAQANAQAIRNIVRAFIIILVGALLYGGGKWLGYSVSTKTQYTFVDWIPPLLSILFGPIVGGTTALAGDLIYQLSLPWKDPVLFFLQSGNRSWMSLNQLSMSSHLLSVIFAGLMVRDTKNWKKVILAGLIILSVPQIISVWSEFSLQFFFGEENWEWYDSLKNMLLDMWVIRTLIPNLVIFSLLLRFTKNKLNQHKWYNDFCGKEKSPASFSIRRFVVLMATGWAIAFSVTFGLKDVRSVLVPTFISISDQRQAFEHTMKMDSFPVDIFLACGICCGLIYAYFFRKKIRKPEWYHLVTIVLGWMIGMQLSMLALDRFLRCIEFKASSDGLEVFYTAAAGLLGGFISSLPILWTNTNIKFQRVLVIAAAWAIGLLLGFLIPPPWSGGCEMNQVIRFFISGFLAGGIGALGTVLATWNLQQDTLPENLPE